MFCDYNAGMAAESHHSRRAFLQGRAAARLLADKAAHWFEGQGALWPSPEPRKEWTSVHLLASRRAMACEFQVQYHAADGPDATEAMVTALDIVDAVEDQLTVYRDVSDVATINAHAGRGPVAVEERLFELCQLSRRLCLETDAAFDITSGPLSRAWGFLKRAGRMPAEAEIAAARNCVGMDCWQLDPERQTITLHSAESEINFNAIGKGYALDQADQWLASQGMSDYLWHGGRSSVLARGRNRALPCPRAQTGQLGNDRQPGAGQIGAGQIGAGQHDNEKRSRGPRSHAIQGQALEGWTIGLPHPLQPNRRLAEFYLCDTALATAGSKTQFFEHQGASYGHVIDPRTGWPANKVITATAIAPTAAEADALATAFYVMGPERTSVYCRRHAQVKCVLICPAEQETDIVIHAFGMAANDWTLFGEDSGQAFQGQGAILKDGSC